MEQFDLLRYATGVLETMRLRYFVTGSTATIFYGDVRFTNDIDIVVDLPGQFYGQTNYYSIFPHAGLAGLGTGVCLCHSAGRY